MPDVTFKAKARDVFNHDGTIAWSYVSVPEITRAHCDMAEFRKAEKYYANSDLFLSAVRGVMRSQGIKKELRLDKLPVGVSVDRSGFLAVVTITLPTVPPRRPA